MSWGGGKIISAFCFSKTENLQTIIISKSVEKISHGAFSECKNLTKVTIPESVNYIGSGAFHWCFKLTSNSVINNSPVLFDWWVQNRLYDGCTMSNMHDIDLSLFKNSAGKNFNVIGQSAFYFCKHITKISTGSLKEIHNYAFKDCTNLERVLLFTGLEKIDDFAFENCENLEEILIPESVTEIGMSIFSKCEKLTFDSVASDSPVLFDWWAKNHKYNGKTMRQMPEIDLSKFRNSHGKEFSIISVFSFASDENLTNLTIPESVTIIRENAFANCTNLTIVIFQGKNKNLHLGAYSFSKYYSVSYLFESWDLFNRLKETEQLKNAKIDEDHCIITVEKSFVFNWQGILTKLTDGGKQETLLNVPNFTNAIAPNAFQGSQAITISIPASVTTIGESAFKSCRELTNIKFIGQSKLITIGTSAFGGCQSLKSITIPNSVTTIGENAFNSCINLESIVIPSSVTKIGDEAFRWCEKLKNVIFQGENRSFTLGNNAFQNTGIKFFYFEDQGLFDKLCDALEKNKCRLSDGDFVFDALKVLVGLTEPGKQKETLIVPNSVTTIGNSAFAQNENLINVIIPKSVEIIKPQAFAGCSNLRSVTFQGNNANLNLGEESFSGDNNTYYYFEDQGSLDNLKLQFEKAKIDKSKCIVTVGKLFVIDGNNILTKLTDEGKQQEELIIPSFVTKIGDGVFQGSQASTIVFSDSVTTIGNNAFADCKKLKTVKFIGQLKLATIGDSAFKNSGLISITLPTSLTTIGDSAFYGTNLTSIVIPELVSEIGARAFGNCNHLESVTFLSGKDRKFSLGEEVFPQNINQFYFNDENLFNLLRSETVAGIISNKCVLVKDYFEIRGDNSLTAITPAAQDLSELTIPGFVKIIGDGTRTVFANCTKNKVIIIPTSVEEIRNNAFQGCDSLTKIIINSTNIKIHQNAFANMPNTDYYIPDNAFIKEQLKQNGINESQIHFLNLSAISIDYATIGIIVGAIVFSIIALGLGIGIPMRKQHRINMLNAKITRNRVDKLAAATALSFKKVLEVSAKTNGKIDKLQSSLIAAKVARPVNRLSQPNRPANPKPPIKKPAKK